MIVGVVKETFPGERRVALIPDIVPLLKKKGFEVVVESGAGRSTVSTATIGLPLCPSPCRRV